MSKQNSVQQLVDMVRDQNVWYLTFIGLLVGIVAIFLAYNGYQQKKISDRQVAKFTSEIEKARKISEDLKKSNERIIQFSLGVMSNEGYMDAIVEWRKKAELYVASKRMFLTYYSGNHILLEDLAHAKLSVLFAFRRKLEDIIRFDDGTTDYARSVNYQQMKECFEVSEMKYPVFNKEVYNYDDQKLRQIGKSLQKEDAINDWYMELNEFNKFWNDETSD